MEILTLESVLADTSSDLFHEFTHFLRQQYCTENLSFYLAVQRYEECARCFFQHDEALKGFEDCVILESSDPFSFSDENLTDSRLTESERFHYGVLQEKCLTIVNTYVRSNSPQEINIPCDMRQDILERVHLHNQYHPAVFNLAIEAVVELMRVNSFIPWLTDNAPSRLPSPPPLMASKTITSSFSFPDRWHLRQLMKSPRSSFASARFEDTGSCADFSVSSTGTKLSMIKRMKRSLGFSYYEPQHASAPNTPRTSNEMIRFSWTTWRKLQR
ncbi:RGS domain-containing protein [Radiomyces spectabilis]|uniref:RGS domain-containing protein n=1 Tax=Radiomyces spectabilis TaxID=64574 RepID=UPI00221FB5FD|nr:RGS domain-containing protein [Radiomyces spectabilis]KAI8384746.1 RGS domain-containing protein [Radiomyces spectabilis]